MSFLCHRPGRFWFLLLHSIEAAIEAVDFLLWH